MAPHTKVYDDEIDLRELFHIFWSGKLLIAGFAFAAAVISVVVSLLFPNIYRAEALLAPNDQESTGSLSALAAQYGGLASLAGISLGSGSIDKVDLGLEVLKSRKFITEFIVRHDILVPLIAADGWDSETGILAIDADDYDVEKGKWVRSVRPPRKTIPSMQEAYEEFIEIMSVEKDTTTGFVELAVEFYSPTVAKQWVDWLIADVNSSVMSQEVAEAEQAIAYLNKQVESTSLTELQSVFFNLIEEQTKTIMLAQVTDEYLLKTIDPAVAPEKKARPKRAIIVTIATSVGAFIGLLLTLLLTALRHDKSA